MLSKFTSGLKAIAKVAKEHPIATFVVVGAIVLFASAPFYAVYRFARSKVPGASALPAK